MVKIIIQPEGKEIKVKKDDNLLNVLQENNIFIESVCGGEGICGKCKVIIKKGKYEKEKLACQTKIKDNLEIIILHYKKIPSAIDIKIKDKKEKLLFYNPISKKISIKLPYPTLDDNIADIERIERELKKSNINNLEIKLFDLKNLPQILRENNFNITTTLIHDKNRNILTKLESGNKSCNNYAVAVDIGTTNIVCSLIDLMNYKEIAVARCRNNQAKYGSDVITRAIYSEKKGGLEVLQKQVVEDIDNLIYELIKKFDIFSDDLNYAIFAGNTIMTHLFLGLSPYYIRREPYIPIIKNSILFNPQDVGLKSLNKNVLCRFIPIVASYVGGDITAGVLATSLYKKDNPCMLIDMGTNGEIVIGNKDFLICCACSIGPAFEGGGTKSGVAAISGAIEKVKIDKDYNVSYQTIDNEEAIGICGAGIVDTIAELLKTGIIDRSGKLNTDKKIDRLVRNKELEFKITDNISITQSDIDNIIRSKAAVYAATNRLLSKCGLSFDDIKEVYIAGAFGYYLNIENAIKIGLLPDIERSKFKVVGNTSLAGAKLCLLNYQYLEEVEEIANKMTYVELSTDNKYYEEFVAALFLPHTNVIKD